MRAIKVKKKCVLIPDSWEDLNYKEKFFTFNILIRVLQGDLKDVPHVGLMKLLMEYTGFRPKAFRLYQWRAKVKYLSIIIWIYLFNIPFLFKYGLRKYRYYFNILKETHLPVKNEQDEKEIIEMGLLRLAESIDFVYKIDTNEKKIIPQYAFKTNPFPYVRIGKNKYTGKRFLCSLTSYTDITARCFVDALDLLILSNKLTDREHKDECISKICAILYPAIKDHNENLLSGHSKNMRRLHPVVKFGIVYWFTGIVNLFSENETYRILFERTKNPTDNGDKINMGMNEIALFLKKEGYGDPETMNLIDYFDAQVKALKDNLTRAVAEGLKPAEISQKTGIPVETINKLT